MTTNNMPDLDRAAKAGREGDAAARADRGLSREEAAA